MKEDKEKKEADDKIRQCLENSKLTDVVFEPVLSSLHRNLGDIGALKALTKPLEMGLAVNKTTVENILKFPEPTRQIAFSNFLFGRIYGKYEILLQLITGRNVRNIDEIMKDWSQ